MTALTGIASSARGEWARRGLLVLHWLAGITVGVLIVAGGADRLATPGYALIREALPGRLWPLWWALLAAAPGVTGLTAQILGHPRLQLAAMVGLGTWYASSSASLIVAAPGRVAPIHSIAVYMVLTAMATLHGLVLRDEARARALTRRAEADREAQ